MSELVVAGRERGLTMAGFRERELTEGERAVARCWGKKNREMQGRKEGLLTERETEKVVIAKASGKKTGSTNAL